MVAVGGEIFGFDGGGCSQKSFISWNCLFFLIRNGMQLLGTRAPEESFFPGLFFY